MKIDRLIGILSVLLQKECVTAPYLAEKFEVSRRTINRDIEALCNAGIPICTRQGQGGGISIMEGYKLDRTLLTGTGLQYVLQGNQDISIDLSSWYKNSLTPKIETIRRSIDEGKELEFVYYAPKGESVRKVQPYYLIFRWASWYMWAWCKDRLDFRLFKLNRMDEVSLCDQTFEKKKVPMPDFSNERIFPQEIQAKVLLEPDCKWRLVEEFGKDSFSTLENGKLLFEFSFSDKENLITWVLSFREKAQLLAPIWLREEIQNSLKGMLERYR